MYWTGVLGSFAVEIGAALKICTEIGGKTPPMYKEPFYLGVRIALALAAAGPLAAFLSNGSGLTAFYLGASAPLVLDQLAKGIRPSE
ncbi:hypothetical protein [Mariluticola halotolerans]|uniref:hypothetical protein n=1 Tax=Mariluticola halotolerans TaxID=2909283 RepID=UPI0026E2E67F|nr:hypothetical protein [Mariluticola halotolerans]UJQ93035.1 hypothetical protein L1P08_08390 [Mariluticola halotolerans]